MTRFINLKEVISNDTERSSIFKKKIDSDRLIMYEKAKDKNLSHPDVLKISQQLDKKIIKIQKIMSVINIH